MKKTVVSKRRRTRPELSPVRQPTKAGRPVKRRFTESEIISFGKGVVEDEAKAVSDAARLLNGDFARAVAKIARCVGRLVVSGMGKANYVGQKVSATFASTGTPSLFLHPGDALHGDLGRMTKDDVLLALSHSGETDEMIRLMDPVQQIGAAVLAITASKTSTLGKKADLTLEMGRWEETGIGLAPTTSTTVMLALGDALAMAVLKVRGFTEEDFRLFHPAGALGRMLMRVQDVMRQGNMLPKVSPKDPLSRVIAVMTKTPGRPGAATVIDRSGKLVGMFTDGDLRRLLEASELELDRPVGELMSKNPKVVRPEDHVREASRVMRDHHIDQVAVVDARGRPIGLLDVQDLLAQRLV